MRDIEKPKWGIGEAMSGIGEAMLGIGTPRWGIGEAMSGIGEAMSGIGTPTWGSAKRPVAGLTLDAGALIAAERSDRRFWAFRKEALRRDLDFTVPAPALAQAWRGGKSARMAMVLAACGVDELDERDAKLAGVLCGKSRTADIVDASVVVGAARRRDDVLTTDPEGLEHLSTFAPKMGKVLDLRRVATR